MDRIHQQRIKFAQCVIEQEKLFVHADEFIRKYKSSPDKINEAIKKIGSFKSMIMDNIKQAGGFVLNACASFDATALNGQLSESFCAELERTFNDKYPYGCHVRLDELKDGQGRIVVSLDRDLASAFCAHLNECAGGAALASPFGFRPLKTEDDDHRELGGLRDMNECYNFIHGCIAEFEAKNLDAGEDQPRDEVGR